MGAPGPGKTDHIILVDEDDVVVGYEEKDRCHRLPAMLHRAFSVFIVNSSGEMLIHKRSALKKTWPGFWTNACCSHPGKDEPLLAAARRRLLEEMGFQVPLQHLFSFRYEAAYDETYGENEIDHVLLGVYDGPVDPDLREVEEWKFVDFRTLKVEAETGDRYTPWFRRALPEVIERMGRLFSSVPT